MLEVQRASLISQQSTQVTPPRHDQSRKQQCGCLSKGLSAGKRRANREEDARLGQEGWMPEHRGAMPPLEAHEQKGHA
jgi:hypothetical protein